MSEFGEESSKKGLPEYSFDILALEPEFSQNNTVVTLHVDKVRPTLDAWLSD